MTRPQALARLQKIAGTKYRVALRVGESVSSPERRAEADAQFQQVTAEIEAVDAKVKAIIAAHAELQALYARRRALVPQKQQLIGWRHYRKFNAYTQEGIALGLLGSGDTWEETIDAAERRRSSK
jgi:hypothetical protein